MARPRKITDDRLLAATEKAIGRLGPAFRLTDVAEEADVAAGTLVQRFGSKRGLLKAMTRAAIDLARHEMRTAGEQSADPVSDVVRVLAARYAPLDDPRSAANNLAQLGFDLADEELRRLMAELYAVTAAELVPLLRRAADAGGLPGAPPAEVAARILTALADGTAIHWSAHPVGTLGDRMRMDITAVLAGWDTAEPRSRRAAKPLNQ